LTFSDKDKGLNMCIDNKASYVAQLLQDYATVSYKLVFPVADGINGLLDCIYILHEGLCDVRQRPKKNPIKTELSLWNNLKSVFLLSNNTRTFFNSQTKSLCFMVSRGNKAASQSAYEGFALLMFCRMWKYLLMKFIIYYTTLVFILLYVCCKSIDAYRHNYNLYKINPASCIIK